MTSTRCDERSRTLSRLVVTTVVGAVLAAGVSCSRAPSGPPPKVFQAPEAAVQALSQAVKKNSIDEVVAIFGADAKDLIDSSDPDRRQPPARGLRGCDGGGMAPG